MNKEKFITLIESIGFKKINDYIYYYKEFKLYLYNTYYSFNNGSWIGYYYSDLTPIKKHFKQELRSIKLKQLLR